MIDADAVLARGDAPYTDVVDFIVRCTHRIWEGKDVGLIATHYVTCRDLQLRDDQLAAAAALFARVGGVRVALCHCGSPWDRSPAGLAAWGAGLRAFASVPGAVAKLSGFGMFEPAWTVASIRPLVAALLDAFGPERLMWGSNFPVDKLARGYRELYESAADCVPTADRAAVFSGTARGFYRIE